MRGRRGSYSQDSGLTTQDSSILASLLTATYYRLTHAGATVPRQGPVLLVANHPNSLLDPMLVRAAARRPVRFLAKAPLWDDPKTAWLVKVGRAIPVYRASDDPALVGRNAAMFDAVQAVLVGGDAVGLFPEGISHSGASLAPLKSGAARIALGTAAVLGAAFPLIPVGLVLRDKERFRSEAMVVVGDAVSWDDLAGRGVGDGEAVRELTARIEAAMRRVTINLERWEDAPLVDTAMAVWEAGRDAAPDPAARVARLAETTRILADVRASPTAETRALAEALATHGRRLARLGIGPTDLATDLSWRGAAGWAALRLPLLLPPMLAVALLGWLLFLLPYRLTGVLADRFAEERDTAATWKLLLGAVLYLAWVLLLAGVVGWGAGWAAAATTAIATPLVGMAGLLVRERWRGAWDDARRWVLLRGRRRLLSSLRNAQEALGRQLDQVVERHFERGPA